MNTSWIGGGGGRERWPSLSKCPRSILLRVSSKVSGEGVIEINAHIV